MAKQKLKILLVENLPVDFKSISTALEDALGEHFEVFPKHARTEKDLASFNCFLEDFIQLAKFDEVLEYYKDVDVFVIDISLKDDNDQLGRELGAKILQIREEARERIIFVSSAQYSEENYIWKSDVAYEQIIVQKILDTYPEIRENILKNDKKVKIDPAQEELSLSGRVSTWKKITEYSQIHGKFYAFTAIVKWLDVNIVKRFIHIVISVIFYGLILLTSVYGGLMIYREFSPNLLSKSTEDHQQVNETNILNHAEHIFLYLLPVFIVFGFYVYYKTNASIFLLSGKIDKIDQENSTVSMNYSKVIFISSIISYVLIKIINKLFDDKMNNITSFIAAGILLLMLMVYFIFINSKKSHGHDKVKP